MFAELKMYEFMNKKILINTLISLIFIISLLFTACDDTITGDDIDNVEIPDKDVSYAEYIQPVFNVKCATSGCHDDGTRAGGYSMTSWSNVLQPGVVDPFNVETSRLIWRIEGLGVDIMPPIGAVVRPLTLNQFEGIKTWIAEGAKNN